MEVEKWFSDGTLDIFLTHYPHLNKNSANAILNSSEVVSNPTETTYDTTDTYLYIRPLTFTMTVPHNVAEAYGVDLNIDLTPDEDGVIYYQKA